MNYLDYACEVGLFMPNDELEGRAVYLKLNTIDCCERRPVAKIFTLLIKLFAALP